ncbi:HD domain-containing protein [Candidatus Kaiserbacteria bacterium]|nr:HD domain-containing protein [Candidatus Kaiserbacteria bacterium]
MNINSILDFITLTNKFRAVKRVVFIKDEGRLENDSEHSYQLAMLSWYLLSEKKTGIDKDLVIKYALIHDFVEVYAGDTWFYRSKAEDESKKKLEAESAIQLKSDLPEFIDFHQLIEDYENQINPESRFVYALDKIIPIMNIYLDGGDNWKEHKVTLDNLIKNKTPKIAVSPEIEPYYNELVAILKDNKDMFHVEHEQDIS